uniref:Uncharacterized protein n=1 Tax=Oryza sativa subsp. japonica TaxID=39947 RepID=Q69S59_ORYSJ|nr:hypothetical protein [Oryza sativa Japonica Group]BAD30887.1 hypothetical protein [Oryza sativa Japonica Group]
MQAAKRINLLAVRTIYTTMDIQGGGRWGGGGARQERRCCIRRRRRGIRGGRRRRENGKAQLPVCLDAAVARRRGCGRGVDDEERRGVTQGRKRAWWWEEEGGGRRATRMTAIAPQWDPVGTRGTPTPTPTRRRGSRQEEQTWANGIRCKSGGGGGGVGEGAGKRGGIYPTGRERLSLDSSLLRFLQRRFLASTASSSESES